MRYFVERFRRFCGFITGFVFFISGILKLLDPTGAGLVMDEYFDFLHIEFLGFASKVLGTVFALAEAFIGTALITGVWRRTTAAAAMGFQAFFTLLTVALVIFNPQMDCGCFGEAIHLSHMETLIKNLILCTLLAMAFIPFRGFGRPRRRKYVSFSIVGIAILMFTAYSWAYIPLVDFTDFKTGVKLAAAENESEEIYEAYFIYEKDGAQERFTLENLPDSTWTFISTETVLKDGATAPVVLSFTDNEGKYKDELATEGKVIIVSIYDTEKVDDHEWNRISKFTEEAAACGLKPMVLVAGEPSGAAAKELADIIYYSDYKSLITMNRSNSGATYFNDGTLICKWSYRSLPDSGKLGEIAHEKGLEQAIDKDTKGSLGFQGFLLYVFAVMLLL